MKIFHKISVVASAIIFTIGVMGPTSATAATAPSLGTAASYGIVSSTYTNSLNAGLETRIIGDVCYTTGPATAPVSISGSTAVPCTNGAAQAAALASLNSQSCTAISGALDAVTIGANPPGTFPPGCYSTVGAMTITLSTTVTLDAIAPGGDGGNVWIFRSGGGITTGADSKVVLVNGANANNVFWTPSGAVLIGANSGTSATPTFVGNIIADALGSTGIGLGHFANLLGRALAFGHTVTTDSNTITVPPSTATLRVEKVVVGGTAIPSNFTVHVKLGGVDVSGSPASGTPTPGTLYTLAPGSYVVSEDANPSYSRVFSGDCDLNGNVALSAGQSKTCTIINTDIALPVPSGGDVFYYNAPLPLINVTKIPSPLALPSGAGSVTYTYTAVNVGQVAMSGVWVKDNKCANVTYISGDSNSNSLLDINEAWVYRCTKTVSVTETNTATAHGSANGWEGYDTANARVVVGQSIVPPLIHVVKKPSVFILPVGGGAVNYSYTVTNPGTAPLSDVSITDDKCTGLPGRVVGHPGDLNKNNLLESNESWSFTCQTNLTQTTTNIGTAVGHANGLIAVDLSPATVAVSAPGLPRTGYEEDAAIKTVKSSLFKGNRSSDVAILQKFLVAQNKGPAAQALAKVAPTTYFGALTRAALAEFQAAVGITPAVGNFGAKTRAYISANY